MHMTWRRIRTRMHVKEFRKALDILAVRGRARTGAVFDAQVCLQFIRVKRLLQLSTERQPRSSSSRMAARRIKESAGELLHHDETKA